MNEELKFLRKLNFFLGGGRRGKGQGGSGWGGQGGFEHNVGGRG